MNKSICFCLVLLAAILASGCRERLSLKSPDPGLKVGVAQTDITPPVGHRMAGYFDERFATGVHDPLWAKAIVLAQGREQVALVFCDVVGVSLSVTTNARARASLQTGIPESHILVAATHSHTGPLFDDVRRDYFHEQAIKQHGRDPHETVYYPDFLADRIVQAIKQAQARCVPGRLSAGIASQAGLSFNRRYHMKNGEVRFNPGRLNPDIVRPAGPIDPDVGCLMLRHSRDDHPLGGLVVFACHCDTVGGTEYSGDYPYYMGETLRHAFGPQFIPAFAAGTCGDINHIDVSTTDVLKGSAFSERMGRTLGQTVLNQLPTLHPITNPALTLRSKTIVAPLQQATHAEVENACQLLPEIASPNVPFMDKVKAVKALDLEKRGSTWPMEVQVIRLDDDTALVGLPGEIFVDLGLAIKARSPFQTTIVMSICNDRPGYVPTVKAFSEGSYEVVNSRVKPGVGEMLVEQAVALLAELKAAE